MENTLYNILILVAIIFVLELLDLPEIIKKKLKGEKSNKDLENKINELQERITKLENKN
jgi:competence protein ComGC